MTTGKLPMPCRRQVAALYSDNGLGIDLGF